MSPAERRAALDRFDSLLKSETDESDWQRFFDDNPRVLVETLSLRCTGLYRQVPLDSGRADYLYHSYDHPNGMGDYGVIELKRPDHPMIGTYTAKHIVRSRKLDLARSETERHLEAVREGSFLSSDDFFVAGNRGHAFIIIGNSKEVTTKCRTELLRKQFQGILPPGFNLYTYDELFGLFSKTIQPLVHILMACNAPEYADLENETLAVESGDGWARATVTVPNLYGLHARPAMQLVELANKHERSSITVSNGSLTVDGKSIMSVMRLAAVKGTQLHFYAEGADSRDAVYDLAALVKNGFGEMDG
jgi:phosphocarrier protein